MVVQSSNDGSVDDAGRQPALEPGPGLLLRQAGHDIAHGAFQAATERCFAVLAYDGACAEAWKILGDAARRLDETQAAREAYQSALAHRPFFPEAWFALGTLSTRMRRFDDARHAFRMTLRQDPGVFEARTNLAVLHYLEGRLDMALAELARSRRIAPPNVRALVLLARVQQRRGALAAAERACRRVLSIEPGHIEAKLVLGRVLYEAGRLHEALETLENVAVCAPDNAEARNELGVVLKALGRIDEARAHLAEGLRLDPRMHGAWPTIADLVDFAQEPELANRVENITRELVADCHRLAGANDPLIPMHFVSGKALDDRGDHARALSHYLAGARLKRVTVAFDEPRQIQFCEQIKTAFSKEYLAGCDLVGDPAATPVFIVGMARSGSTLVEQILANHPAVHGLGEARHLPRAIEAVRHRDRALPPYPTIAGALRQDHVTAIAGAYLGRAMASAGGAPRITDKLLTNYFHVGLIHMLFPNARIINTLRDPVDTCLSAFTTHFAEDVPYSHDFGELGRHYCRYVDLMAHWRTVLPDGVMTSVAYEDLVADPEAEVRRLLGFLGLPWDDACLDFHQSARSVQTASVAQVRKPLYRSSVARWRRYGAGLDPLVEALQPCAGRPGGLAIAPA